MVKADTAPNAGRTLKHFFARFTYERARFQQSLRGSLSPYDRERYTALLLNRLMLLYFLQRLGMLDNNPNYLADKLQLLQETAGDNSFLSFYHYLLSRLFGRETHQEQRQVTYNFEAVAGHVPLLTRNLLETYEYEQCSNIQIPDEAFEQILLFFHLHDWQITPQPVYRAHVVSPESVIDLFEKQISQKQMGAYYTERDVADYICEHTLIPAIFRAVPLSLANWRLLAQQPEHYIRAALRQQAPLASETAREYSRRQTRYQTLRDLLQRGELTSIEDLLTYNLDSVRLLQDSIAQSTHSGELRAYYQRIATVSILDPTCGTGALLCAAVHILEILYATCIERIHCFVTPPTCPPSTGEGPTADGDVLFFQTLLQAIAAYPNWNAFIIHSIISNNLYGVDIMPEAVEMCKVRLFLRFIAACKTGEEVEHCMHLSFHIRSGNTLVNAIPGGTAGPSDWLNAFQRPLAQGGFDVVIGNPPYIESRKLRDAHNAQEDIPVRYSNLYAAVIERALTLCQGEHSYLGMIVPLSICGSERFAPLREILLNQTSHLWLANFAIFPCRLFRGAFQRLSIVLATTGGGTRTKLAVTGIQRWYADERPHLMELIAYTEANPSSQIHIFPKVASPLQTSILHKVQTWSKAHTVAQALALHPTAHFVYYQEATNYWAKATCRVPFYTKNGVQMTPPHGRLLYFNDEHTAQAVMALMNSSLFYLWFATYSDGFHLGHTLVKTFPASNDILNSQALGELGQRLEEAIRHAARMSTRNTRSQNNVHQIALEEYHMAATKPLLDKIDALLATYYGFTCNELDFIIHYDSKYRIGREGVPCVVALSDSPTANPLKRQTSSKGRE